MDMAVVQREITQALENSGLTAAKASRLASGNPSLVKNILAGHTPRVDSLARLAKVLNIDFHFGPPHTGADLYSEARNPDDNPPENAAQNIFQRASISSSAYPDSLAIIVQDFVSRLLEAGADPIPPKMRDELLRAQKQELDELRRQVRDAEAYAFPPRFFMEAAAGSGEAAEQEHGPGNVAFRFGWLSDHEVEAKNLALVDVKGDSMEPTIRDGDTALVDLAQRLPIGGCIFALWMDDGPVVKRLRQRVDGWWADSDNADHKPRIATENDEIIGQVVGWAHAERGPRSGNSQEPSHRS